MIDKSKFCIQLEFLFLQIITQYIEQTPRTIIYKLETILSVLWKSLLTSIEILCGKITFLIRYSFNDLKSCSYVI